jgi:hypothetical protein
MHFKATNYTVSILLLLAFTVATMIVRGKKPPEHNWPLVYWVLITVVSLKWPEDTWDYRAILTGATAGLLLRFEFMGPALVKVVRAVEFCVWIFILYAGLALILY